MFCFLSGTVDIELLSFIGIAVIPFLDFSITFPLSGRV